MAISVLKNSKEISGLPLRAYTGNPEDLIVQIARHVWREIADTNEIDETDVVEISIRVKKRSR